MEFVFKIIAPNKAFTIRKNEGVYIVKEFGESTTN